MDKLLQTRNAYGAQAFTLKGCADRTGAVVLCLSQLGIFYLNIWLVDGCGVIGKKAWILITVTS